MCGSAKRKEVLQLLFFLFVNNSPRLKEAVLTAGTLENYSVPCELTFLLRKIENWISPSVLASSIPTLCSEYFHPGPHSLCLQNRILCLLPLAWKSWCPEADPGSSEESFKSLGSLGEWWGGLGWEWSSRLHFEMLRWFWPPENWMRSSLPEAGHWACWEPLLVPSGSR